MKAAAIPINEPARLQALARYQILDSAPEAAFDDLARLASQLCGTPIALITFVDEQRQWFKSRIGLAATQTPREQSFCAHAILQPGVTIVPDAAQDAWFADNPMVTGPERLRFYAGTPLVTPQGHALGTLCVLDRRRRHLNAEQLDALLALGRQVVTQLELRLHVIELEREAAEHRRTEAALREAEHKYRGIFESVVEGIFQTTPDGRFLSANPMLARIYGFGTPEELVASFSDLSRQLYVDPNRRAEFTRRMEQEETITKFESEVYHQNGSIIWISENARAVRDAAGKLLYYEGTVEDITERKRGEEALRQSELRFRSVWENSADGMRLTDKHGNILAVNPCFCAIVGMKEEELVGRPFTVVYQTGEDSERRLAQYRKLFAERAFASHQERRLTFRTRATVDIEVSNSFVEDTGGDPLLLSIFHDFTARKRTEEALRESEILYHSLVENLPQNIFRKDLQERFTFVNQRFCDTLGRPREDFIGKTDFDFFPPEVAAQYQRDDRHVIETREFYDLVEVHPTPDQGDRFVQVIKSPIIDGRGNVIGIQGIFWDVTERKRTEEQLAFQRDLLRALLDNVPDRIYFKDRDSRFLQCSLAMARRLGLQDPEQVVGKTDFDFHPPKDATEFFEDEQHLLRTGVPLINKIERQTATGGAEIWASVTKVPTRNRAGEVTGIIGISRDITDLIRTEHELAVARDLALESVRIKSQFLAMMSHEIRTPMNAIVGMTQLILDTPLTPEQRDFAETVRVSAYALLDIINDILDFSKIEAGKLAFETLDFDLRATVEGAVDVLAQRAQAKGLELAALVPDGVPTRLRGDASRLRQILVNLIGNAVKFTEQGEVVVRASQERVTDTHRVILFTIHDTGIGIPAEALGKIFAPFTQADGSTTRKFGGTGLGLAISKQLVELMGGQIGVESGTERGSTFWFSLPLEPQPGADEESPAGALAGVKVLVVDDNATQRQFLLHQLRGWKMLAAEADTGAVALTRLRQEASAGRPFDLVLLDQHMPEMDGLALAHHIRTDRLISSPRLVLLTTLGRKLDAELLHSAGIAACLVKPLKHGRLHDSLVAVITGTEAPLEPLAVGPAVGPEEKLPVRARRDVRILMAEDNSVNQKVALLQLQKLGYDADTVANGRQALEALRERPYEIILMDCHMPEMDGYEATLRIRQREQEAALHANPGPPVYIVAMTANALQEDFEACLAAGMNAFISKPVVLEELQAVLERVSLRTTAPPVEDGSANGAGPPVDLTVMAGLRELGAPGEPDPLAELIELFMADAPERLQQMQAALAAGDAPLLRTLAHTCKGSANNLGARPMAAVSARLEEDAKAGELSGAPARLEQLRAEYARVEQVLRDERNKIVAASGQSP